MKPGILKTTTALALSLSLVVPAPILAQGQGQGQDPGQEMTDEQRRQFLQQQRENAEEAGSQGGDRQNGQGQGGQGQDASRDGQAAAEEQAEPQGQGNAAPQAEDQQAAPEPQLEAAPEVQADPESQADPEPQAAPEAQAAPEQEVPQAEQPAQPEAAPEQTDPQGESGAAPTEEGRTGADELRESLGASDTASEPAEQDAPAAAAEGNAPAEAEAPAAGNDPATTEAPAESGENEPASAETPAEAEAPAESNDPAAADAPADSDDPAAAEAPADSADPAAQGTESAETPADGNAPAAAGQDSQSSATGEDPSSVDELRERMRADQEGEPAQGEEAADQPTQQDPQDEAESAERRQQDADALAEQDRAGQSAAAAQEGADGAEMVEETITEESARSSDEEFDTAVGENVERQERREDDDDDEDDGERAEKLRTFLGGAAAGALGAVALDRILQPNEEVVSDTGDRIVVERDGQYRVLRNDDALLRQPGANVTSYQYDDGSTRSVVTREDGTEIETIRAADGRVLRRLRTLPSGDQVVLFDDTQSFQEVSVNELPPLADQRQVIEYRGNDQQELANALASAGVQNIDRSFSLNQVRNIAEVRRQVPEINVDSVNFETGSAVIRPEEAEALSALGNAMRDIIDERPGEVFLIEGHTDAVGSASMNLALSDRRAESVALALTEYFDVPPENMVVQGYGESDLLIRTEDDERANRRAAVRRITPLLTAQQQ